ncbi:acyl carrier protein [Streptomyces sp. cmx-4-9]|uniref:acyl carrier protein n=1 Tax=Streptomyces sp. cmx-4-9 TaxID=2790941 RepID=UPI003980E7B3
MEIEATRELVHGLIAKILSAPPEKITPDARLREDLDADSLDFAELTAALAEHGIHLDKAHVREAVTVEALVTLAGAA